MLRGQEGGWSLLESIIAMSLLSIGIVGIATVLVSSLTLVAINREKALAMEAGRKVVEEMSKSVSFPQIFAAYNAITNDDPPGVPCPGSELEVPGLKGAAGGPALASISFPTRPAEPAVLREDCNDAALGLPRDLNGDGQVDALNHATDYRLLPVAVRVSWTGVAGNQAALLRTIITKR